MTETEALVLVVDDDPDIRTFLEVTLMVAGFEVVQARDGAEALAAAREHGPAVILLDVMMPNVNGFEALEQLRSDGRTSHIPVIMVTAKAQGLDKVQGLAQGADDYVTKPFDPEELIARVKATLRRAAEMRTVSPLTGLPGNVRIEQELARRVSAGTPFAVLYADLNQFKAYNDHYGFIAGDRVLVATAELLRGVTREVGTAETFLGHVGGDDFVIVTEADHYEEMAEVICTRFDDRAPEFYAPEDRARGFIHVMDRRGNEARVGLVSISIGIAHNLRRSFEHHSEVVEVAAEMKIYAKQAADGTSNWAVDRRADLE